MRCRKRSDQEFSKMPFGRPSSSTRPLCRKIIRHAAFYAVPPLAILQHFLPEVLSLRAADLDLTEDQVDRVALTFSIEPTAVRRMTFSNLPQSSQRLIAGEPRRLCCSCGRSLYGAHIIRQKQFLCWRITCPLCGCVLQSITRRARPSPFSRYYHAALIGERILDDEANHCIQNWASQSQIARLRQTRRGSFSRMARSRKTQALRSSSSHVRRTRTRGT
jgi:hypothetical protein